MECIKAIQVSDNTIINIVIINANDNPSIYGAIALARDNQDAEVGWILKDNRWVDPNPIIPIELEPDLTAEQIAAALLS